ISHGGRSASTADRMTLALAGLVVSALFTGAAFYVNAVEQPARLALPPVPMLQEWKPAYHNGTLMQAPLAVLAFVLGGAAWWQTGAVAYLAAGIVMIANLPWTFLIIFPTNKKLEATPNASADMSTRMLIERWGRLHAVRTAFGGAAVGLFT